MAIINLIPGLEISIAVDNIALPEYEDEIDEDGMRGPQHRAVARKYVESSSDKEFAIQLKLHDPYRMDFDSLLFYISIDGKPMAKPVISKDQYPLCFRGDIVRKTIKRTIEGATVPGDERDKYRLRKFRFSKIKMSSDDAKLISVEADSKSMKDVGEIEVKVYRAIQPQVALGTDFKLDPKSLNVHERALKGQAKSHNTSLGPAIKPVQTSFVNCAKIDEFHSPYGVFKFKYRSRQALKSLMIIARTPSPEPEPRIEPRSEPEVAAAAVDLNNLDEAQRLRVQQFLQGTINSSTHSSPTPGRTIKREHENGEGSVLRKKSRTGEKITIDLTLDSDDE